MTEAARGGRTKPENKGKQENRAKHSEGNANGETIDALRAARAYGKAPENQDFPELYAQALNKI